MKLIADSNGDRRLKKKKKHQPLAHVMTVCRFGALTHLILFKQSASQCM